MSNQTSDPWNFSNSDPDLLSPDGLWKVEFGPLYEFVMGGPIGGECFLVKNNIKTTLSKFCGGPIVWSRDSEQLALPVWLQNKNQKMVVVNVVHLSITTYKEEFSVLHLKHFENDIITGVDSPLSSATNVLFDLKMEDVEKIRKLRLNR